MSLSKKKGLGKGFDALMPQNLENMLSDRSKDRVQNVFISQIAPNPDQPRRNFDQQALDELADSIKQFGVLQPLVVRPKGDGYEIIAGERRWRASKQAGLDEVPVVVRTPKELEQLEMAMVENIQRVDLSPLEQAATIAKLHEIFKQSYEQIAKRLNKAESTVNNIVRLLQLPDEAQDALRDGLISEGHARSILALKKFPDKQAELLRLIIMRQWSVRQAEQFVVAAKSDTVKSDAAQKRASATTPQTEELTKILKRPVSVAHMAKGGRLIIRFRTDDDLSNLVELLSKLR